MTTRVTRQSRQGRGNTSPETGQATIFATMGIAGLAFFGLTAFAVDFGSVLQVRQELQAATDAAALSAAQALSSGDTQTALNLATSYSGVYGAKNYKVNHPATMVSGYPQAKCVASTGIPCAPYNAVVVKQKAVAPLVFGKIVGLDAMDVYATATASAKGAGPLVLDVAVIVDISGSMNSSCNSSISGVSQPKKIDCAKAGMRALLTSLWPCHANRGNCGSATNGQVANPHDSVALFAFPGLKQSSRIPRHYDCSDNLTCSSYSCDYEKFNSSPYYQVVPLSSDYKLTATGTPNGSSSKLVKSMDWSNGAGCSSNSYGVEAVSGSGSSIGTYFADVITEASNYLLSSGRPNVQKVIIFLSDGDANSYSGMGSNQCQRAITAAQAAKNAGMWVYSIAYEAYTSQSSCNTDSSLSAYQTMQQIASDSSKFYNQPQPGDLTQIFQKIAQDMTAVRLISD